jgi:hypothetical protein
LRTCLLALFLTLAPALLAQNTLTNDAVIKMTKAGLSDELIVTTVNASQSRFDTSADGLIALKTGGVTDKVVSAILLKATSATTSGASSVASPVLAKPSENDSPTVPGEPSSTRPAEPSEPGSASGWARIAPGARVVIAPMGGFETYFAAAVREKKVPVTLTLDKPSAQYFIVSTNTEWQGFVYGSGGAASWNRSGGTAAYGSSASSTRGLEASVMLIDARTKDIVWAYEVHKNSHGALIFGTFGARGQQSVAEACAKHLKEYIEKGK